MNLLTMSVTVNAALTDVSDVLHTSDTCAIMGDGGRWLMISIAHSVNATFMINDAVTLTDMVNRPDPQINQFA